jgi:hypothetical protein
MKKHIAIIEKVSYEVVCLEAEQARDLLSWQDIDSFRNLPMNTLDKLKRIEREQPGCWRFLKIQSEDDIIENSYKTPELPRFTVFGALPNLEGDY